MSSSSAQEFSLRTSISIVADAAKSRLVGLLPTERLAAAAAAPLLLVLSGCLMGPNYKRPAVSAPPTYRAPVAPPPQAETASQTQPTQTADFADLPWWEVFHDDTLTQLIKTALANNHDLGAAVARVEQADQVGAQARSQYFPVLGYATLTSYGHNQFVYSPIAPPSGAQGFLMAIGRASWEADLWGRIRRTNEAAQAQLLATEEARRGVMLTLASGVSQAYFELLGLRYQLDIAKASKESLAENLKLVTQREQEGLGNGLQTSRAATELANASGSIPELERQIALKENQISVLLGKNPGPIETKPKYLGEVPPEIPAGLPSSLLERRPDVRAAEAAMRSANAQIGIAQAAYFPTIGLTTFFGKLSTPLENLSSNRTNAWSLAASISGPIFTAGAITAQKHQAIAAWEQTREQYLQTALSAFRDVSDALISREKIDEIRAEQAKAVQANEDALRLTTLRYDNGLAGNIAVIEANQRLYSTQLALAQTEIGRRLVVVQLYRALGGGWKLTDAQWVAAGTAPDAQSPAPATKP